MLSQFQSGTKRSARYMKRMVATMVGGGGGMNTLGLDISRVFTSSIRLWLLLHDGKTKDGEFFSNIHIRPTW